MPLVTLNGVLPQARKAGRAVCAINVANLETLLAVIKAAELEQSPIIVQVYERLFGSEFADMIAAMTIRLAEKSSIPIVLHLDHGVSLDQLKQAIDSGYTSVMIDGSKLGFDKNVDLTLQGVELARKAGVSIEAEIGHVPFGDGDIELSTPQEAVEFVDKTGVDALAVSIGTAHGFYSEAPSLDIARAREIGNSIAIPIVLHGASGTPAEQVREAITCGIAKINVATEFQDGVLKNIATQCGQVDSFIPIDKFMMPVIEQACEHVRQIIRSFNNG